MRTRIIAAMAVLLLAGGGVLAHDAKDGDGSLERRLAAVEKAIERLEARISQGGAGGMMMEGCPMMGGGGMMGGKPNRQWR